MTEGGIYSDRGELSKEVTATKMISNVTRQLLSHSHKETKSNHLKREKH